VHLALRPIVLPVLLVSLLLGATAASADGVEEMDRLSRRTDGLVTEGKAEELFFSLTPGGWKKAETGHPHSGGVTDQSSRCSKFSR
jgi:hypothetical protein